MKNKKLVTFIGGELDMQRHSLSSVHNGMIYKNMAYQILSAGEPDLTKRQSCVAEIEEYEVVKWVTTAGTTVWVGFYNA